MPKICSSVKAKIHGMKEWNSKWLIMIIERVSISNRYTVVYRAIKVCETLIHDSYQQIEKLDNWGIVRNLIILIPDLQYAIYVV
jgi:hypothetical protein